jgi:adenylate kinase family enzyme
VCRHSRAQSGPSEGGAINKIWVTGNAGVGKTALADLLGRSFGLPVHGLDLIVWQPGWRKTPDDQKLAAIAALTSADRWVIEGVSIPGMRQADLVVFLDLPRRVAIMRAMRRTLRFGFRTRPELPERCPEILITRRLLRVIWRFRRHTRPQLLAAIGECAGQQAVVHIRTRAEQRQLVALLDEGSRAYASRTGE